LDIAGQDCNVTGNVLVTPSETHCLAQGIFLKNPLIFFNMKKYLEKLGLGSSKEEQRSLPLSFKNISAGAVRLQKLRKKNKRSELYFSPEEHKRLSSLAKQHKLKLSPFLKASVLAYHEKLFILPDRTILYDLQLELLRQGTNLNQIAYLCQREKHVRTESVDEVIQHVKRLEKSISDALMYPDDLESLVHQALKEKPEFIVTLQFILNSHCSDDH
jgi:hypothetical protein